MTASTDFANLRVLQLNCRSFKSKVLEIRQVLEQEQISVACLSETKTSASLSIDIPNYQIACRIDDRTHGSLVLVRDNLAFETIESFCTGQGSEVLERTAMVLTTPSSKVTICNIYNSPGRTLSPNEIIPPYYRLLSFDWRL